MIKEVQISLTEFRELSQFVQINYGIKLPESKLLMVKGRLQKRLRHLNINSFKEYFDLVFSEKGHQGEMLEMMNLLTTNKTDFFREIVHFQFLQEHVLPQLSPENIFKVWSAGSSSGEEAYTIAISIREFQNKYNKPRDFNIFATDLSTEVLAKGQRAVYKEEQIASIPLELKKRYFLRGKDQSQKIVRVQKSLRDRVQFSWLNLISSNYNVSEYFNVIFCRNTLIYFDRDTQEQVLNKLCLHLKSGGYLFLGHSESINNLNVPLEQICPTIFKKK